MKAARPATAAKPAAKVCLAPEPSEVSVEAISEVIVLDPIVVSKVVDSSETVLTIAEVVVEASVSFPAPPVIVLDPTVVS